MPSRASTEDMHPVSTGSGGDGERKVAVVTASTAGIGLSIAHALANASFHVIISSRSSANVDAAVKHVQATHGKGSASGIVCDVGEASHRERLLDFASARGRVSALVLNAAVSTVYGPLLETSSKEWDKIFDVNLRAAFLLVKLFAPCMHRGSSIVFVTSIAAYTALPGLGAYSISKTALLGMCKVMSVELAPRGIRVNAVAPGLIRTNFSEGLWKGENSLGAAAETGKGKLAKLFYIPMQRLGDPDDVGPVVSFLVSDDASYITGETIVIAGGAKSKL